MSTTNLFSLEGRTAIITGGSRGLGREMALAFAEHGANIVVASRKQENCEVVANEVRAMGRRALAVGYHAASWDDAGRLANAAIAEFGHIDILVNNAGITGGNGTTWDLDPEVWKRVIDVNLMGPYYTCRHVTPHMVSRGWGRIVNIASVAGKEGNPNASHYSVSKAGVIALTKSLAKEVATKGVLVNAVAPAAAKTAMFATMAQTHIDYMLSKIPMGRFVEVDEIAAMVSWLSSEDCSFTTGSVFDITGGRSTY